MRSSDVNIKLRNKDGDLQMTDMEMQIAPATNKQISKNAQMPNNVLVGMTASVLYVYNDCNLGYYVGAFRNGKRNLKEFSIIRYDNPSANTTTYKILFINNFI